MSYKDGSSSHPLLPRCLVMIFSKEDDEQRKVGDSSESIFDGCEKNDENIELFEDFIEENKGCFWDPHLEESLSNISIAGIIFPNSVLVTGRDIHLDTIRRAWSKRVLRSPVHYTLLTVGEFYVLNCLLSHGRSRLIPRGLFQRGHVIYKLALSDYK